MLRHGLGLAALLSTLMPALGLALMSLVIALRVTLEIALRVALLRALRILGRLLGLVLGLLSRRRRHDAVIMLRMLKVILGHHPVAGGIGVAGELKIFLIDMRRRAADFDLRSRGIESAVGVVSPTAIAAAITAAAAIAVLRPATAST